MLEYAIDAQSGRIDDHSIRCRLHGSDAALTIAFVTRGYFPKKGREVNTNSFTYQLFIAPLRAFLNTGSEEYFKRRIGKNNAPHVPAIGHQARWPAKCALARQQRLAHPWIAGDARGIVATTLAAQLLANKPAAENRPGNFVIGAEAELHVQLPAQIGKPLLVVQGHGLLFGAQGYQSIQRAAVQKVKAQVSGQMPAQRTLADSARPIDGDDRDLDRPLTGGVAHLPVATLMASPAPRARSGKPGNEVATLAQSSTTTGSVATNPAMLKAMAMR